MASVNQVNAGKTEFHAEKEVKEPAEQKQETLSVWDKLDTDGDGKFSKGDDLYIGIQREVNYRVAHNLKDKLTEQLKDLLNYVGNSFDAIHQKIQTIYESRYGKGNYKEISTKFMETRAEMAHGEESEVFDGYISQNKSKKVSASSSLSASKQKSLKEQEKSAYTYSGSEKLYSRNKEKMEKILDSAKKQYIENGYKNGYKFQNTGIEDLVSMKAIAARYDLTTTDNPVGSDGKLIPHDETIILQVNFKFNNGEEVMLETQFPNKD